MKTGKINLSDCYPKSIFDITYACSIKRRHFLENSVCTITENEKVRYLMVYEIECKCPN